MTLLIVSRPICDAVELGQVRGDVAHGHAAGVEAEDLVVQPRQSGLALAHQLWARTCPARSRGVLTCTGPRSVSTVFGTVAVADVAAPLRHAARRVAEVIGQLGPQGGLDHAAGQLGQQPARVR